MVAGIHGALAVVNRLFASSGKDSTRSFAGH
jgi:hypothetical protein